MLYKEEILNYLDIWAELYKTADKFRRMPGYEDEFEMCSPFTTGVHVYRGISEYAAAAGQVVKKESYSLDCPYRLSFEYKGVEFFCIGEEPE